jgi:hypothetical protein
MRSCGLHGIEGLRVIDALDLPQHHQRQHQCADGDGGGKGRCDDPRGRALDRNVLI